MPKYFIRFLETEGQAQADLDRGFSYYGPGRDEEDKLSGLSGYGPYEDLEEARYAARTRKHPVETEKVAIFTGRYVGADPDSGELFEPSSLVEVSNRNRYPHISAAAQKWPYDHAEKHRQAALKGHRK